MLSSQNPGLVAEAAVRSTAPVDSTNTLAYAIAAHLNATHQGQRTVLRLLVHRLLWPEEVLQGKSLDAPDTYLVEAEIQYPPPAEANMPAPDAGSSERAAEEVSP
jgi:hypothetical protein